MRCGIDVCGDLLKRSNSSSASTYSGVNNFRALQSKYKSPHDLRLSSDYNILRDLQRRNEVPKTHHNSAELSSRSSHSSYYDEVSSTVEDISPLIPQSSVHNRESYKNYAAISTDSIGESTIQQIHPTPPQVDLDSLSVAGDDDTSIPRISKMNDPDYKKNKPVKPQTIVKPCTKSENKIIESLIQMSQNMSVLQGQKNKSNSKHKPKLKLEKKKFSEESKSSQPYKSTLTEEKTYSELIDRDIKSRFLIDPSRITSRHHHSSISDSENPLTHIDKSVLHEGMVMSRSDGSEVPHVENQLKFYSNKPKSNSCEGTISQRSCNKTLFGNIDLRPMITTSSQSLPTPTSLECRSNLMLHRQASTPLPNFSTELSVSDSSDHGPPLPAKTGSRSNLSSPLYSLDELFSSIKRSTRNDPFCSLSPPPPTPPQRTLHAKLSQPLQNNLSSQAHIYNPNKHNHPNSHTILEIPACHPEIRSNVTPQLPARQIVGNISNENPPLPPKSKHTTSLAHKHSTLNGVERLHREEEDIVEETSEVASDSSTFNPSKDSVGPEGCPDNCLWKQSFPAESESRNALPSTKSSRNVALNIYDTSNATHDTCLQTIFDEEIIKEVNKPTPGRYDTSDSVVYEEVPNFADSRMKYKRRFVFIQQFFIEVILFSISCSKFTRFNGHDGQKFFTHEKQQFIALESTNGDGFYGNCNIWLFGFFEMSKNIKKTSGINDKNLSFPFFTNPRYLSLKNFVAYHIVNGMILCCGIGGVLCPKQSMKLRSGMNCGTASKTA
ncbi:hypothetical protein HELRODRAFT_188467 [Helobdella robusta]|uniref:Uncharacterized protein n=1 Tax=Helobdella robusta TaxID=6412 RepID=T1FQ08_HELRO|nr:hypothetical protein HELRODRAFT_188467 [Helobdella robusta]ESO06715.1 hypothetical protein HELRODRAFT_188467 [Helobdella robusta]